MAAARNRSRGGRVAAEVTSFVGRRGELAQVRGLLAASRLVTLTGVGGCGKTRLALRVVVEARRAFPDGVWQVDLAPVHDPALLGYAVAAALDLDDQSDRPVAEVLAGYLRDRELLLVLDNCEHLLDGCAALLGVLLPAAAGVRVLATSRQPVGMLGEQVWPVPPLPVPEPGRPLQGGAALRYPALALFAERAAAVQPGFALTADTEALVARICRDLNGLPLAIELAAARLRTLSLEQLADGLSDRLRLLRARAGTPTHHRSLQAAFDWSFALCTPAEQALWAALSVFADSVDLPAVEAVCGEPADRILTALVGLVDKSILIRDDRDGPVRYRLLETIRQYGLARLREQPGDHPGGREEALRRLHRDFYLRLAECGETGWSGVDQEGTYLGLRREHPNLRAALGFCLSTPGQARAGLHLAGTLWFYWTGCGFLREGRFWLDRLLAADTTAAPEPSSERTKALWATGAVAVAEGDTATATRALADSWQQAQAAGDERTVGLAGLSLGMVALFADDYPRARQLFEQALGRFDALGEENPATLLGRATLAMIAAVQGDLGRAEEICRDTLAACEQRGDQWTTAWVRYVLALLALARGDLPAGVAQAREGLRGFVVFHNLTGIAMLLELYAQLLVADRKAEQAAVVHGVAGEIWQVMGRRLFGSAALEAQHEQCETLARQSIGDAAYEAAQHRGARLDFDEALAYALGEAPAAVTAAASPGSTGPPGPARLAPLTPRERQVAELVGQGLSNRQIAARLVTSRRTAESHVANILRKLGLASRTQLAAWLTTQQYEP
jgi:predicted ATPase/DNA-binding CsgD family transcriptional regulator